MSGPGSTPPAYAEVKDPAFQEGLKKLEWKKNDQFGGLVLQGECPICKDGQDGIDVFVPVVIAQFQADQANATELVVCACSKNHGAPAGKSGCGRWGYSTPSISRG